MDSDSLSLRNLDSIVARVSSISTGPDFSSANSQQPIRSPVGSEHNAAAHGHHSQGSGTTSEASPSATVAGEAATVPAKKYEVQRRALHHRTDDDDDDEVLYRQVCANTQ